MLVQQIKDRFLEARKARDTIIAKFLSTLLNDVEMVGLNDGKRVTTDEEAIAIIKKFIKNAEFNLEKGVYPEEAVVEIEILRDFLPKQLSNDQLAEIIKAIPDNANFGNVMKVLKTNHAGLFDGGNARTVWQSLQ